MGKGTLVREEILKLQLSAEERRKRTIANDLGNGRARVSHRRVVTQEPERPDVAPQVVHRPLSYD